MFDGRTKGGALFNREDGNDNMNPKERGRLYATNGSNLAKACDPMVLTDSAQKEWNTGYEEGQKDCLSDPRDSAAPPDTLPKS